MKKGLVNIAQGSPEQLSKLKIFIENMKNIYPDRKLKTLASGVEFAVEQAQKVPELENEISKLEQGIIEVSYECGDLKIENERLKKRIEELEKTQRNYNETL
jgi:chromosome segregation ATPase